MVNVDFITVVRIRFQYQMCIGTFVVSRNLSARQDGALHPQPKIRPPDRHARLYLRARALNRLFSDIRRRWLRTRLEIIHPDAVEGIQVSDSYLKKFGSGRPLHRETHYRRGVLLLSEARGLVQNFPIWGQRLVDALRRQRSQVTTKSDVISVDELTHKLIADAKALGIRRSEIDEDVDSLYRTILNAMVHYDPGLPE